MKQALQGRKQDDYYAHPRGDLYFLIVFSVRIMGKRQIGELQPSELVITILISEIAAIPMQDNGAPLINSVIPVLLLISFEVIASVVSMKFPKFRGLMQGHSLIVIRNGMIDQTQLKRLRFTVDDLMEALRQKDVFRIEDVQYAIAETNGTLSVLLKPEKRVPVAEELNVTIPDDGLPCIVISDGRIITSAFKDCGMTMKKLQTHIKKSGLELKDILIMEIDRSGNTTIIKRDERLNNGKMG